jgi:hypothetical protein
VQTQPTARSTSRWTYNSYREPCPSKQLVRALQQKCLQVHHQVVRVSAQASLRGVAALLINDEGVHLLARLCASSDSIWNTSQPNRPSSVVCSVALPTWTSPPPLKRTIHAVHSPLRTLRSASPRTRLPAYCHHLPSQASIYRSQIPLLSLCLCIIFISANSNTLNEHWQLVKSNGKVP